MELQLNSTKLSRKSQCQHFPQTASQNRKGRSTTKPSLQRTKFTKEKEYHRLISLSNMHAKVSNKIQNEFKNIQLSYIMSIKALS